MTSKDLYDQGCDLQIWKIGNSKFPIFLHFLRSLQWGFWTPTGHQRYTYGTPTGHQRDTYGTPTVHLRDTNGTPTGHQRDTNGTPTGHQRDTYDTPTGHLPDNQNLCGVQSIFLLMSTILYQFVKNCPFWTKFFCHTVFLRYYGKMVEIKR